MYEEGSLLKLGIEILFKNCEIQVVEVENIRNISSLEKL